MRARISIFYGSRITVLLLTRTFIRACRDLAAALTAAQQQEAAAPPGTRRKAVIVEARARVFELPAVKAAGLSPDIWREPRGKFVGEEEDPDVGLEHDLDVADGSPALNEAFKQLLLALFSVESLGYPAGSITHSTLALRYFTDQDREEHLFAVDAGSLNEFQPSGEPGPDYQRVAISGPGTEPYRTGAPPLPDRAASFENILGDLSLPRECCGRSSNDITLQAGRGWLQPAWQVVVSEE